MMSKDDVVFNRVVQFNTVSPLGKPRGRSLKPPLAKRSSNQHEDHEDTLKRRDEFVASSDIVKAVQQRKDAAEMLQNIKLELAKEVAILQFTQTEGESKNEDVSDISTRRIRALREIVNIEASISKMGIAAFDVKSEKFQKIVKYFFECIRESAVEILDPEQVDLLFNRIETHLDGWEDRVQGL